MALKLKKDLHNGVQATYHRIKSYTLDFESNEAEIIINSYVSEKQRDVERDLEIKHSHLYELREKLNALIENANPKNEQERIEISEEINKIAPELDSIDASRELYVAQSKEIIKLENAKKDFTRESIYKLLSSKGYSFENASQI